jgi:hypothetical protein
MTLASNFSLWSVAGQVYGFAGAALICNAAFLAPPPFSNFAGSNISNTNRAEQLRVSQQWLDTRVGAALLAVGFFFQLTGTVGSETLNAPAVFTLLGLAVFAAYYALSKDLLAERLLPADAPAEALQTNFDEQPVLEISKPEREGAALQLSLKT